MSETINNEKSFIYLFIVCLRHVGIYKGPHAQKTHAAKGVCIPSRHHWQEAITLNMLKRSAAKGEQNQSLCLSWPCLPDWAAPLCETSHRKTLAPRIQQATLMCKCMQGKFQKSRNYRAKWGSCTQIVGIMNNYRTVCGSFLNFLWNNDFGWFNWGKSKCGVKLLFCSGWRLELPMPTFTSWMRAHQRGSWSRNRFL